MLGQFVWVPFRRHETLASVGSMRHGGPSPGGGNGSGTGHLDSGPTGYHTGAHAELRRREILRSDSTQERAVWLL